MNRGFHSFHLQSILQCLGGLLGSVAIFVALTAIQLIAQEPIELSPVLLQMIRDDAVHEELNLEPEEIESIVNLLPSVDAPWFRARNLPLEKRVTEIDRLTMQLRQLLQPLLSDRQRERLAQLERQALGTRMVLRDDIAQKIGLSKGQQAKYAKAVQKTIDEANQINEQRKSGNIDQAKANRKTAQLQTQERQAMVKTLTKKQRTTLSELTGSPFDFSQVKRMYPMPPEFETDGVQWIQGGPLKLKELRGQVVAVHYYAFQCINCIRNLPHYKAWHEDYADQGLVVIGIQTPETPSERSLEKVAAAAKENGIEYPVMLDQESSNWNAWSNTMWPTVYLIDKRGFLRRWWQGEMNWQGTPGEKQMRETVEMLLAE